MPIYKVEGPDGRVYRFEGPEGASENDVLQFAQQQFNQHSTGAPVGNAGGPGRSAVYGFNSMVPFGNKITSALGAGIAKGMGAEESFGDLYRQAFADEEATAEENPLSNLAGMGVGIVPAIMMASTAGAGNLPNNISKARSAVNAIPKAIQKTGDFVRGGTQAQQRLLPTMLRSSAVAAPSFALYGAGEAEPGQETQGAIDSLGPGVAFGAGIPAVARTAKGIGNAIAPVVDEATAKLAQKVKEMGLDISMDQLAPTRVRSTIQKISQEIPGSGVDAYQDSQKKQWNRLVARTLGLDTEDLGPEAIQQFVQNAHQKFSTATAGRNIVFGQKDLQRLADIPTQAGEKITDDLVKIVKNNVDSFINNSEFRFGQPGMASGRIIPGEKLANLRSQLIAELPSIQGGARQHVAKIIDVLDDVTAREIGPENAAILKEARREWRNFKTIEPLLEGSTDGTINPTALMNRVKSNKFIKASRTETGDDDLVTLARAGKQFLSKKGGSDTFQKSAMMFGTGAGLTGLATAPAETLLAAMIAMGGMTTNRAFQELINRSPSLVNRSIKKSLQQAEKPKQLPSRKPKQIKGEKK